MGRKNRIGWQRRSAALVAAIALGWCHAAHAGARASDADAAVRDITRITLERHCFGCAAAFTLSLDRDGGVTYTTHGTARSATADQTLTGHVDGASFDALARLIVRQGFFDMDDTYEDPDIRDGAWSTTSVVRGTNDKRVFRREDAGPPSLRQVEAAIESVKAGASLKPR